MGIYDTIGGTPQHDPSADRSERCDICRNYPGDCTCPKCPTCGVQGDPKCYAEHGLRPTRTKNYPRAREECLAIGSHMWGEGRFKGVCLRCGEGAQLIENT